MVLSLVLLCFMSYILCCFMYRSSIVYLFVGPVVEVPVLELLLRQRPLPPIITSTTRFGQGEGGGRRGHGRGLGGGGMGRRRALSPDPAG